MTAETPQVHCQLSEVAMEEENSGHQHHQPDVGADCNGINNNDNNDNDNNKKNVGGKDDPDGSYVFVSRSESANGDLIDRDLETDGVSMSTMVSEPIDIEGQAGKLNHHSDEVVPAVSDCVGAESNCNGKGTDVVLQVCKQQPTVAGIDVVGQQVQFPIATVGSVCKEGIINRDARLDKEIEPDSACDLQQNQELPAEFDRSGTPLLNDGKIESQEEINSSSGAESGDVMECQVLVPEEDKPENQTAIENWEQAKTAHSEPSECDSTLPNEGKLNYKDHAIVGLPADPKGSQESEVMVSEAANCELPGVEVQLDEEKVILDSTAELGEESQMLCDSSLPNEGKLNYKDHAIVGLPADPKGSQESEVMVSEAANCELPGVEVQLNEEKVILDSTAELGEESQMLISELGNLNNEEEKPEKQSTPRTAASSEGEDAQIIYSEPSECKSLSNDETILKSKESAYIELYTEVERRDESQVIVSEAAECKSADLDVPEVIAKIESTVVESESRHLDNRDVKLDEEEKSDLTSDVKENQESQLFLHDCVNSGSEEVDKIAKLANETVLLEAEIADKHVLHASNGSCPSPHVYGEMTQDQIHNELIDGCQNTTEFDDCENVRSLLDPADCQRSEFGTGSLSCPAEEAKVEIEFKHDTVEGEISRRFNKASSGIESDLSANPEGNLSTSPAAEVSNQSEVSNGVVDCASMQSIAVNSLDSEYRAIDEIQDGYGANMKPGSHVEIRPPVSVQEMPCSDRDVSQSEALNSSIVNSGSEPSCVLEAWGVQEDGDQVNGGNGDNFDILKCQKVEPSDGNIADALKEMSSDALNEKTTGVECVKRPFNFLIKVPRFDDENLREEIRLAHVQVHEKTQQRDAIRDDMHMTTAICQQLRDSYEAARSEERGARGLLNLKRKEIDSVQHLINRVKNAISVEDMNVRINNMEHMIQHETLPLKEEKHLIRQINQLKHLRDQLSSNMGSQDEVQQALDQRDQNEEKLKILKKELDCLKDKVSKTQATAWTADKKWNEESKKLKELHVQFRAADKVRQAAYVQLQDLKGQLYDKHVLLVDRDELWWMRAICSTSPDSSLSGKTGQGSLLEFRNPKQNAQFRQYKNDTAAAYEYASNQKKEGLHHLCLNQVEKIMDLWNKDDEYRKEYLRCNTRSTLRRFRTSDGRALGPDEEPITLPNFVDDRSFAARCNETSELPMSPLEKEKQGSNMEGEGTYSKSTVKVEEQIDQIGNTKKPGKPTLRSGVETVSGRDNAEEMSEVEPEKTKEQEFARKEEELRNEEAVAKLKEQQRQEEKAKAREALERKRRNAEKAQFKAELRAQKEAEQKEKEREKKAKKKERKKAAASEGPEGNNEGETVLASESPLVTAKEAETEESPVTVTKRPQKASQFTKQSKTKSIPPPLRNRGKRRMQQWIWIIFTAVVVLALFLLGNIGFYSNLGHNLRMRNYGF